MARVGSPYEVRCRRCDVSFPPEARRCIHCGGPTSASEFGASAAAFSPPPSISPGSSVPPMSSMPPTPPTSTSGADPSPFGVGDAAPAPEDESPAGPASLFRSLGSVLWVVALVVFSIVRSCGEG